MTAYFSLEIIKARSGITFSSTERKELSLRSLYSAKLSFRDEGEIKVFSDEGNLRKFVVGRLVLQNNKR